MAPHEHHRWEAAAAAAGAPGVLRGVRPSLRGGSTGGGECADPPRGGPLRSLHTGCGLCSWAYWCMNGTGTACAHVFPVHGHCEQVLQVSGPVLCHTQVGCVCARVACACTSCVSTLRGGVREGSRWPTTIGSPTPAGSGPRPRSAIWCHRAGPQPSGLPDPGHQEPPCEGARWMASTRGYGHHHQTAAGPGQPPDGVERTSVYHPGRSRRSVTTSLGTGRLDDIIHSVAPCTPLVCLGSGSVGQGGWPRAQCPRTRGPTGALGGLWSRAGWGRSTAAGPAAAEVPPPMPTPARAARQHPRAANFQTQTGKPPAEQTRTEWSSIFKRSYFVSPLRFFCFSFHVLTPLLVRARTCGGDRRTITRGSKFTVRLGKAGWQRGRTEQGFKNHSEGEENP